MQLITGRTGEQHVKAVDDAEIYRTLLGDGDFVLTTGEKFSARMSGANELNVYNGTAIMQGRQTKIRPSEGYETVRLDNGTVGYYRWDIVVIEYSQENEIEKAELKVIKGTPSKTYVEPTVPHLNGVIDNGETHQMKLWGVKYNGINFDSLVDYRAILDTTPINTALDAVKAAENEITQRLIGLAGRGRTVPQFVAEAENVEISDGSITIEKPIGYAYEDTDVFDLYLNGLMCRPSQYQVSDSENGLKITIINAESGIYDEAVIRIWEVED